MCDGSNTTFTYASGIQRFSHTVTTVKQVEYFWGVPEFSTKYYRHTVLRYEEVAVLQPAVVALLTPMFTDGKHPRAKPTSTIQVLASFMTA